LEKALEGSQLCRLLRQGRNRGIPLPTDRSARPAAQSQEALRQATSAQTLFDDRSRLSSHSPGDGQAVGVVDLSDRRANSPKSLHARIAGAITSRFVSGAKCVRFPGSQSRACTRPHRSRQGRICSCDGHNDRQNRAVHSGVGFISRVYRPVAGGGNVEPERWPTEIPG